MRVLVACEFSGIVREAFRRRGHDAFSCDLLPAEDGSRFHIQFDARLAILEGWDLMIAHPPCTHLAVSGARWFKEKRAEQEQALEFVARLLAAPIRRIALENPISIISSRIRKPDQIIQPWQYGHEETKATCLWLKNLASARVDKRCQGRNGKAAGQGTRPRAPCIARPRQMERTIADASWNCQCDGRSVERSTNSRCSKRFFRRSRRMTQSVTSQNRGASS